MYLLSPLIIDQLFFELINTLNFINNLIIDIKTDLIDTVKFVFLCFLGFVRIFLPTIYSSCVSAIFYFPWI